MPGKNTIKYINSLKQKKFRKEHGLFIVEGEKMVDELLAGRFSIHSLYATDGWLSTHPGEKPFSTFKIGESDLKRISSLTTPNKVLALAHIPSTCPEPVNLENSLTLVLDNIQDPGNLGTLIRSCHWFGIENIVLSENSAEATSPKVVQATMGSLFHVRTHYLELISFLEDAARKKIPVYGAFPGGPAIYDQPLGNEGVIILGNESKGISAGVEKYVTRKISIPSLPGKGRQPESLNMAVAGSIIIAEFRRRAIQKNNPG